MKQLFKISLNGSKYIEHLFTTNKPIVLAVIALATQLSPFNLAYAGGGGLNDYLCYSSSKHISIVLESQLGSDLYKPGLQLFVSVNNTSSLYSIISYSDDGNLIRFTMNPVAGQPDFGTLIFSDWTSPAAKTQIQLTKNGKTINANDVHCHLNN